MGGICSLDNFTRDNDTCDSSRDWPQLDPLIIYFKWMGGESDDKRLGFQEFRLPPWRQAPIVQHAYA